MKIESILRHGALLCASLIMGWSLTTVQGILVPGSQSPMFDAPLPGMLAIAIVVVSFYLVWILGVRLAGIVNALVIISAASILLIFDKYLFGFRSLEHFLSGVAWIALFWGGMALVDLFLGDHDE